MKVGVSRVGRRAGLDSAFTPSVHVGHHGRSGALMALTEHGGQTPAVSRDYQKVIVLSPQNWKNEGITLESECFFGG